MREIELWKTEENKKYDLNTCKSFTYPITVSRITPYYGNHKIEIKTFVRKADERGYFYTCIVTNHIVYDMSKVEEEWQKAYGRFMNQVYAFQVAGTYMPEFSTLCDSDKTEAERLFLSYVM